MRYALWRDRLTLLILALLPWQARYIKQPAALYGTPWEQGTVSLFALEVLLLCALACHLLAAGSRQEMRRSKAPLWLQLSALLPLCAFVSIAWAYDTIGALFTALHVFEGYALAYLLWVSGASLASLLAAFVIGATTTAALGLWQFFSQSSFASTWLGMAAHPASEAGSVVVETAAGRYLRAYGSLPHPNILGGYVVMGLLAAFALAAGRVRKNWPLLGAIAVLSAGLIAAFSRSAWLAGLCAFILALAYPRATANRNVWRRLIPAFLSASAGIAFVAAFAAPLLFVRVSAQGRLETKSVDERRASDLRGLSMFASHLSLGTGIGNYLPTVFLERGLEDDPYAVQPPHLAPLLVGAELGFFGLAILVGFCALWWVDAAWLMRRTASASAALAAALPVVIFVVSCFDHYPFDLLAGTMLTGAAFGFFLKAGEQSGS